MKITRETLRASNEDRYHRQGLISWWSQDRLARARILVVGAGALGNEVLKLLALTGVGNTLVYDLDHIEHSNLSRSVLFRDGDEGQPKAELAAARMRGMNPTVRCQGRTHNVLLDVGLGVFEWADVVIGAVDNREARVFVNSACARVERTWIDGGIEGLNGVVRGFEPWRSACYECTMNATDRQVLAQRRSCAVLARDVVARGHVPTTAVAASIVAAMQVQEAIKHLHGQPTLIGEGTYVNGLASEVTRIRYPRRENCPGHDSLGPITRLPARTDERTLGALLDRAEASLGRGAVLDLSRDVVTHLTCSECNAKVSACGVLGRLSEAQALCPDCGTHRIVDYTASIGRDSEVDMERTLADLGLPPFDIVVARNGLSAHQAWLFDGDAETVLGKLYSSWEQETNDT